MKNFILCSVYNLTPTKAMSQMFPGKSGKILDSGYSLEPMWTTVSPIIVYKLIKLVISFFAQCQLVN